MKILQIFFLFLLVCTLTVACKKKPQPGHATFKPGEVFELKLNGSAQIAEGDLKLTFTAVTEDSRCPKGLDCFQEGRIKITLAAISGQVRVMEFSRQASQEGVVARQFENFNIQWLEVSPYPEQGLKIRPEDYTLKMAVKQEERG